MCYSRSPALTELNKLIAEGRAHEFEEKRLAGIEQRRAFERSIPYVVEPTIPDDNDVYDDATDDDDDMEGSQNHISIKQERSSATPSSATVVGQTRTPIVSSLRLRTKGTYTKAATATKRKYMTAPATVPRAQPTRTYRKRHVQEDDAYIGRSKRIRDTICDQNDGDRCYFNSLFTDFVNLPEKVKLVTKTKLMQVNNFDVA